MSNVFFTSDLHIGHAKVAEIRGFDSVEEHDEWIMMLFYESVTKRDQVHILGDLSSGSSEGEQKALELLAGFKQDVNAPLHLVPGNHDSVSAIHKNSHRHFDKFLEVFDSIQMFARRKIDGQNVMLSHFPYEGDHTEKERYSQFRLKKSDWTLLHGHTHQSHIYEDGMINVGVDAWDGLAPMHKIAKYVALHRDTK